MAISYNTGTAVGVNIAGVSDTITIPSGVLAGDLVLVLVFLFTTYTGGSPVLSLSSTATTPVQLGTQQNTGVNASIQVCSSIYSIAATASDPSATLTYSSTLINGSDNFYNVGLVSYTGAAGVDVNAGTQFFNVSNGTVVTPSATTTFSGDWQVQLIGEGPSNGNNFSVPGGITQRQSITSGGNSGLLLEIGDSNASVGGAGTGIGNTTWPCSPGSANTWSTSFTVGIYPPQAAATLPTSWSRMRLS